ncbi:MAG TPA: hypothetical protein V6C72_09740 [Chroococcales cyanobacterium]
MNFRLLTLFALCTMFASSCSQKGPDAVTKLSFTPRPKLKADETLVNLKHCSLMRERDPIFSVDQSGNPKMTELEPESLVRGEISLDGQKTIFYLPANGPHPIACAEKSHLQNTSTLISVDANKNGKLESYEGWFANMPVRLGDRMFTVKQIDPGSQWILLAKAEVPLSGFVVGKPCPDFKFTTTRGKKITLADYKGKELLLDVWSMT